MYIPRHAERCLKKLRRGFPIVAVTGPRQSGKTTLVRKVFAAKPYTSLEDPETLEFAREDPRGFLARYPDGAVLDEVQRCPDLFSYLQGIVDERGEMGHFILTGSQQFGLHAGVSQTLAGRVGFVPLLPLSLGELREAGRAPARLENLLFQGLFPPLYDRCVDPRIWYAGYVRTYVERDVRQMVNVRDLTSFHRFVRMCAARTGQQLNLSSLASDCGITHNTARSWISVLEASYLVHLLPPHHRNFSKRMVKSPRLHFTDPGLAAWLLGIEDPKQITTHAARGALFESWVVAELLKGRFNRGLASNLFFWRDRTGHEVDVLIDRGDTLVPVEIKSGRTVAADFLDPLETWRRIAGDASGRPFLVFGGDRSQHRESVTILPWTEIDELVGRVAGG